MPRTAQHSYSSLPDPGATAALVILAELVAADIAAAVDTKLSR
jgi:hypothetical protein